MLLVRAHNIFYHKKVCFVLIISRPLEILSVKKKLVGNLLSLQSFGEFMFVIEEKGGSREDLMRRGQQGELFYRCVRDLARRREVLYRGASSRLIIWDSEEVHLGRRVEGWGRNLNLTL
uniref:Uncharacterized protein n=1 Tax=Timema cristinae TaxID=61476 RepID=A0A7R9CEZ0_TIMCR|nr:unnamed protein product [Timema cristinae]